MLEFFSRAGIMGFALGLDFYLFLGCQEFNDLGI